MKKPIIIDSIFGGWVASKYFGEKGQFLASVAIDPDVPLTDTSTDIKTAGAIRPIGYAKFSGATLDQTPMWIVTTPKDAKIWVYGVGGDIYSYDSAFGTETLERAVATASGQGFAYYNNYVYYVRNGDVGRYGPLTSSPGFTDNFWTNTLSLTAPANTTYPVTRHSLNYPNHPMHFHVDNKLYFGDVVNGQGVIHFIRTKKVTNQGDTNDGSTFNALDLPFDYMPFDIESYGSQLVVAASQTTNAVLNQGESALFFWDTIASSFSKIVRIPDPLVSALKYQNGILYGWSGNISGGVRFWRYVGGDTIQTLKYIEEGHPPMAGAVEAYGNRVLWGGFTTDPANSASVFAYGSKSDLFPRGLHNVIRSSVTASSSNGLVTALKNVQQSSSAFPKFVVGATDGTNTNLDKQGTTYQTSVWRSEVFRINSSFEITKIRLALGQAVAANMTIVPKLFIDDESISQAGTTINSTNYANSERYINQTADDFSSTTSGKNNFYLELTFSGTALSAVLLPIEIEINIDENPML